MPEEECGMEHAPPSNSCSESCAVAAATTPFRVPAAHADEREANAAAMMSLIGTMQTHGVSKGEILACGFNHTGKVERHARGLGPNAQRCYAFFGATEPGPDTPNARRDTELRVWLLQVMKLLIIAHRDNVFPKVLPRIKERFLTVCELFLDDFGPLPPHIFNFRYKLRSKNPAAGVREFMNENPDFLPRPGQGGGGTR